MKIEFKLIIPFVVFTVETIYFLAKLGPRTLHPGGTQALMILHAHYEAR